MPLSFEAVAPDGTPRRFSGMHRPPFESYSGKGYIHCSCGLILQTFGAARDHWQMGHMDTPLYDDGEPTEEHCEH